jgi:hypothetical protein
MAYQKRAALIAALAVALAGTIALLPREAEAHGGRGHGAFYGGAFIGHGWGYGFSPWGFGPYYGWGWGPYPYNQPAGGIDMNVAMMAGYGAVDHDVKPNRADVWVDGRYVGEARDLDGYPSYLWLADGPHKLAVYKGGYRTFEEDIAVQRGMKTQVKVHLEPGDSAPPWPKPAQKPAEQKYDK